MAIGRTISLPADDSPSALYSPIDIRSTLRFDVKGDTFSVLPFLARLELKSCNLAEKYSRRCERAIYALLRHTFSFAPNRKLSDQIYLKKILMDSVSGLLSSLISKYHSWFSILAQRIEMFRREDSEIIRQMGNDYRKQ